MASMEEARAMYEMIMGIPPQPVQPTTLLVPPALLQETQQLLDSLHNDHVDAHMTATHAMMSHSMQNAGRAAAIARDALAASVLNSASAPISELEEMNNPVMFFQPGETVTVTVGGEVSELAEERAMREAGHITVTNNNWATTDFRYTGRIRYSAVGAAQSWVGVYGSTA